MRTLRSRDNSFVKQLIALTHSSRERKKARLTVLDGVHLVRAYVDALGAPQEVVIAESALTRPEVMALRTLLNDVGITVTADAPTISGKLA